MEDRRLQRATMLVVTLSSFVIPLLLSAPNVSVPAIAAELGVNAVDVGWVSTAYLLASAVFLLPFGRIADIHGRLRVYLGGLAVLLVFSILSAAAPNFPLLIAARFLQGIGAGMAYATALALISSVYPREQRGTAIGITVSAVYFGLTAGPLVGGWVTHQFGWRMAFAFPAPLLLLCLVLGKLRITGEWAGSPGERLDWPGTFLYATGIIALMLGVSRLPGIVGWTTVGLGLACTVAFFRFERGREQPVFDVTLFYTNRVFTFSCLAALLMYAATFANTFLMSLYLQTIKGMNAQSAGIVMIAQPLMQALASPLAGRLADRMQPRVLASLGVSLTAAGLLLLASIDSAAPLAWAVTGLLLVGAGFGLFSAPNVSAIMGAVPARLYGTAGSTVSTVRVVGQMFSMGVITVVTALVMGPLAIEPAHYALLGQAIRLTFAVCAVLCLAGLGLSLARGQVTR